MKNNYNECLSSSEKSDNNKNTNNQPQTKHHHYPPIVLHHPRIIQKTQLKIQIIRFYGEILACICEAVFSDAVTAF
jgi:hypothetical protein